ncbi:translation initiation factor IF-2 [Patescibacteria group bacterium]|nr:translation initiation factor IF-2 [Patescibacteria group bacterium]
MNITELARRLKVTPNELKQNLPKLGFHIGPRAIQIPDKQAEKVIKIWQEKSEKEKVLAKIKEKISQKNEKEKTSESCKVITLPPTIQVYRFAEELSMSVPKVMSELMKNGILASVNENLDYEIAAIIAENLGVKTVRGEIEQEDLTIALKSKLEEILKKEDKKNLEPRPPVVVVMGHVDHGKSSILDAIRKSKIVDQEKGGITQHIGAYQVEINNHLITFIDTPGHEAFQCMRARGGELADIAILVIAADDGVLLQTLESVKIIQQEGIPFIVAINKIDKPGVDVERVKKDLSKINLIPEDWGGKVICVPVSAKTREGIDDLLETINLVAEMEKDKLLTNPKGDLLGVVVESHLDSGFGPVASIIVYQGTLEKGDNVVIGQTYGRLRSIKDQLGNLVDIAKASFPVQIYGLKSLPQAGELIEVIKDNREFKKRIKQMTQSPAFKQEAFAVNYSQQKDKDKSVKSIKYINIILRTNVVGSLEAITQDLKKLDHPEVKIKILKKGLGDLTEADVDLAKAAQAWLISFETQISKSAKQLAYELNLKVNHYQVIYDLTEDIKEEINKLLLPEVSEKKIGKFEVLKIFQQTNKEIILGGRVIEGKIIKDGIARVWQTEIVNGEKKEPELKGEGRLTQLQINKKDVQEVKLGTECGMKFMGRVKIEIGDILEIYQEIKKQRKI